MIQVTDTTINQGTGTAPSSTTSFYLSINSVLETSDPVVATRLVPELAAGTSSTGTTSITLPDGLAPGSYTLFVKADGPALDRRANEFNNTRFGFIQIGADITVAALSGPATAGAGSTIAVSDTTSNSGLGTACGIGHPLLFVGGLHLDAADVLLQGRAVPALDGRHSSTRQREHSRFRRRRGRHVLPDRQSGRP